MYVENPPQLCVCVRLSFPLCVCASFLCDLLYQCICVFVNSKCHIFIEETGFKKGVKKLNKYFYIYLFTCYSYEKAVFVVSATTKAKFILFFIRFLIFIIFKNFVYSNEIQMKVFNVKHQPFLMHCLIFIFDLYFVVTCFDFIKKMFFLST